MKISQLIIFAAAILYNGQAFSQQTNENPGKNKLHLADFYFTSGIISQRNNNVSLADFQKNTPQSVMLHSDLSGYSSNYGWGSNTSTVYSVMAGFRWGTAQRSIFRLGVNYYSLPYADAQIWKQITTPTDTFTSSQTGEELYVSKITQQSYYMQTPSDYLRIDAAYIYNMLPQKRVSFYTGFGAGTSFSINSHTDIMYSEFTYSQTVDKNGETMSGRSDFTSNSLVAESHKAGANYGVLAYIPLGLDFQLTRNGDNLLQRTHIVYEFRPGINIQSGPLGNFTALQWQHNLGLRVALK